MGTVHGKGRGKKGPRKAKRRHQLQQSRRRMLYMECPGCGALFEMARNALACRVTRHALVPPHSSKGTTMHWVRKHPKMGCGAPLQIKQRQTEDGDTEFYAIIHPRGYNS
mmetsp:Transcript_27810/g.38462  ORF Transcript_27810/g.38462 Transcript_27810/m.38462 type:complete len:110 (+) Transcript_27810:2-331(+)